MTRGQLSCTEKLFGCFYCHRQKPSPNHMHVRVWPTVQFQPWHAENTAAHTPSRSSVKTEPIQTLASDKCLPFVRKEDPMMSWLPRQNARISGLFLMHGWNHIQGWKEAFHYKNLPKLRSFHTDVFLQIFQNFINAPPPLQLERSDASEELSYYGSVRVCVLQNVFVPLPPSPGCAQTASLQPCLSFCPLQQTPTETENQSLLQSPIICNPQGTLIHTTWPKKTTNVSFDTKPLRWCGLNFVSQTFHSNSRK